MNSAAQSPASSPAVRSPALSMPRPVRIVILISGRGSNMMALVEAIARERLPVEVAGVISNKADAAGLAWAAERGIATRVVEHRGYPSREAFDQALGDAIDALAPDAETRWVFLAGFMRVLTAGFVQRYANRLINIHPALLPAHPGLHTHRQALDAGAMLHGATVHLVTPEVDVGPIIAQAIVPVLAGDTEDVLGSRVLTMEHRLFPMVLDWVACGRISLSDDGRVLLDGHDHPQSRVLLHPLLVSADSGARSA